MGYNFKSCARNQPLLLPANLDEWLPEDHPARFVVDAVEQMDMTRFLVAYRADGIGQAAYAPQAMVSLLMYSYAIGERSSRKIEKECETDVAYRYIMANERPDHGTICRFRETQEAPQGETFIRVLRMCQEAGLVKVGVVALDGTKVTASAALSANQKKEALEAEVKKMPAEAKSTDAWEDAEYGKNRRGDEMPEELRSRRGRQARIRECPERLRAEEGTVREAQEKKIAQREEAEAKSGKKKRGRKPKLPEEVVDAEVKANVTDPGSRIMKTRKGYVQGYNAQAAATEEQIIVAADVTQEENDQRQSTPMAEQAKENLAAVKAEQEIGAVLVDAGYCSEGNSNSEAAGGPELFCATTKDWKQRKALRENPTPRGRMPKWMTVKDRMERKLPTQRGRWMYRKRGKTIEPVFGQIKTVQDGGRCMRRGVKAVRSEWRFTCGAHNLLKLRRSRRVG